MSRLPPLFLYTAAFCAGVGALLFTHIELPLPLVFLPAIASIVALVCLSSSTSALIAFLLAGTACAQSALMAAGADCRQGLRDGARTIAFGAFAAQPLPNASTTPFTLDSLSSVATRGRACDQVIRVRAKTSVPGNARAGEAMRISGTWWAGDAAAGGAYSGVLAADSISIVHTSGRGQLLVRVRAAAERRVRELFGKQWPMADALLLARTDVLDRDLRDRFATSGLSHLLAISGTHVMMIAGIVLLVCGMLRLPARTSAIVTAVTSIVYVLFLGAPYPAVRAVIQVLLLLGARTLQRPSNPYALLAASGLAILAYDPLAAADAGFQLSFAGIIGILWLREPAIALMPHRLPRPLKDALATSIAATAVTTPVAAIDFGRIAPIGILANLIAVPLAGLAVPALVLTMAVSYASRAAAVFLASGCEMLLAALDRVAELAVAVPGGHATVAPAAAYAWSAAALLAVLVVREMAPRREAAGGRTPARGVARRIQWLTGTAVACSLVVVLPALARPGSETLDIYAIDVGQGDAVAVRTPGGHWILVDAGPRSDDYDAGRSRVVPFLLSHGARRIDVLILSHPHADHIGGAAAVLAALPVGLIVDPAVAYGGSMYLDLMRDAAGRREKWLASAPGRELRVDEVALMFLNRGDESLDGSDDANEFSVVFRLAYGGFGALFLGDAPADVERRIVAREGAGLHAQLLKVAHHGSAGSSSAELLAAVSPEIALVSVGRRNRYGHPAPPTMQRLAERHVRVLRTDERGTIAIRVSRNGHMQVTTAR